MKTIPTLTKILEGLRDQYGVYNFKAALRVIKQKKVAVDGREPRKRFPWSKYQKLYQRQKGICPLCQEVMVLLKGEVEIDHRDPHQLEFNKETNLQLTHKKCNRSKSSKTLYEYAKSKHKTVIECL